MLESFSYQANPLRVLFGSGTITKVPEELDRLGIKRPLVLSTPPQRSQAERLSQLIAPRASAIFADAVVHTPIKVTEVAIRLLHEFKADGVVAIGGGATIGLSKAIALRTDLAQLVLPTSYAGSEMTPILGETADGIKTTQSSLAVLPETVVYDVDLTISMPPTFSGISGLNAIAHAVEAIYARDTNPIIAMMAEEAIAKLAKALPVIRNKPDDSNARWDALCGAWLCGICLGSVGMALHHKLCHTVGALFDLPHAETHAVLLPHTVAYNVPAVRPLMARVSRALGVEDAAHGLFVLSRRLNAPESLAQIGMPANGIDRAADIAMKNPYWNPRPIERDEIRQLLGRAWFGKPPQSE